MTARIVVVSASIGEGHDGVARELARRLRCAGFTVDCHDFIALWPGGRLLRASYARQLQVAPHSWGWLLTALAKWPPFAGLVVAWAAIGAGRRLRRVLPDRPLLVVSTYPLASQALGRLRRLGRLPAPVVTFLTDMSVHPLWISPSVDAHLALHGVAAAQAHALGARGVWVTGPAVAPPFQPGGTADRGAVRAWFGLPPRAPLALVVTGSWGVGEISAAVADIAATGVAVPVVACGRNDALRARLANSGIAAVGWTDQLANLIRACDLVVQNAGGLTSLEALACGVPVLSYRCLPGHGQTNAAALDQAGWARWVRRPSELTAAVKIALTEPAGAPPSPATGPIDVLVSLAGGRL